MTLENGSPNTNKYPDGYRWLTDDEWGKLKFRTKAHFIRILSGLRKYGQDVYVDGAVEALMFIAEQSWDIVRGKDRPIKPPPFFNRYDDDRYKADD